MSNWSNSPPITYNKEKMIRNILKILKKCKEKGEKGIRAWGVAEELNINEITAERYLYKMALLDKTIELIDFGSGYFGKRVLLWRIRE